MSKARTQKKVWKILCNHTAGRLGRRALSRRFLGRARRLVVRRPTREDAAVIRRMLQMGREKEVPRLTRPHVWADFQGKRVRAVPGGIYITPVKQPFHEYLVDHLLWTLGEPWFRGQMQRQPEERHVILRWRAEIFEELKRRGCKPGDIMSIPQTGNIKSLLVLADDVWQVEQAGGVPELMRASLGNFEGFQGARYEFAVAAAFVRAGFRVDFGDFIKDRSAKRPEFIATLPSRGERVAVEAKSPHRAGVLHEQVGGGPPPEEVRKKVGRLLGEALGQIGNVDCPALVFLDLNLPLSPGVPTQEKPWFRDLEATVHFQLSRQTAVPPRLVSVVVTNFGWHYYRDTPGGDGEYLIVQLPDRRGEVSEEAWALVHRALSEYGFIPDPERHEQAVEARYPEFNPRRGSQNWRAEVASCPLCGDGRANRGRQAHDGAAWDVKGSVELSYFVPGACGCPRFAIVSDDERVLAGDKEVRRRRVVEVLRVRNEGLPESRWFEVRDKGAWAYVPVSGPTVGDVKAGRSL